MSMVTKSWFTLDEAQSKFGIQQETILQWVEDGVVRAETEGQVVRVNGDDVVLKLEELVNP